jgi:hypothetical protein
MMPCVYEDWDARISILAGGTSYRPDTLMQTDEITSYEPLADGAGHTFLKLMLRRAKNRHTALRLPVILRLLHRPDNFVKRQVRLLCNQTQ